MCSTPFFAPYLKSKNIDIKSKRMQRFSEDCGEENWLIKVEKGHGKKLSNTILRVRYKVMLQPAISKHWKMHALECTGGQNPLRRLFNYSSNHIQHKIR